MSNVPNYYKIEFSVIAFSVSDNLSEVRDFVDSLEDTINKNITEEKIRVSVKKTIKITQ